MGYCATEKSITLGKLQKKIILLMAWSFRGGGRAIKSGGGGKAIKEKNFFFFVFF